MPSRNRSRKNPAYTSRNHVELIRGGSRFFERLGRMIDDAKTVIHLQTYIFDDDETGREIGSRLMAAAGRDVNVFLLVDGYASQNLSRDYIEELRSAGIQFRWFEPVFRSRHFYFGRRLHHKVIVIDGKAAMVSGANISNRYNDLPGVPAWMDWAVYTEGEVSYSIHNVCVDLWTKSDWAKKKRRVMKIAVKETHAKNECLVRIRRQDWVRSKSQISRSYVEMLRNAKSHVIIMSGYFLPGRVIKKNIGAAAARGVSIRVIVAGKSDVMLAKHAERYMYRWLKRNGVELYEYLPSVLHGKLSTYDSEWVTIGSYNVNNISAYASIEMNLDVLNNAFASAVEEQLEEIIAKHCIRITEESLTRKFGFFDRIWQKLCYEIIRLLLFLFTFYFRQRR